MDKKRYLKTEIKSICGLRNEIESCKGTITLLSETGHMHFIFRHESGECRDDFSRVFYRAFNRIFVFSPTPHGCAYVGEFTDCQFRFTEKSEFTKYSAEFRGIKYIEKILNHEILNPKLKIYTDKASVCTSDDFYADKVFNFRGVEVYD